MQDRWVRNVFNPNWVRSKNGLYEIIRIGCYSYHVWSYITSNFSFSFDFNTLNYFLNDPILK